MGKTRLFINNTIMAFVLDTASYLLFTYGSSTKESNGWYLLFFIKFDLVLFVLFLMFNLIVSAVKHDFQLSLYPIHFNVLLAPDWHVSGFVNIISAICGRIFPDRGKKWQKHSFKIGIRAHQKCQEIIGWIYTSINIKQLCKKYRCQDEIHIPTHPLPK